MDKDIKWIGYYVDDDGHTWDEWYCNDCNTNIDDKKEEMELHDCKKDYQKVLSKTSKEYVKEWEQKKGYK